MRLVSTFLCYVAVCGTVLGWWYLAFKSPQNHGEPHQGPISHSEQALPLFQFLSPFHRNTIQTALGGDVSLMAKLIVDWELDAQILQEHGVKKIRRLSRSSYIRSQVLARQLKQQQSSLNPVRFLPQTYVAASFLLALINPEQIVAIPRGLRDQAHLFSLELTSRIPLDIDRYNSEQLYLAKPDVAFVAHYSHPSTLHALRRQGVRLFPLKNIETLTDITEALDSVGLVTNCTRKAELLKIFIEASMLAIDNRLMALNLPSLESPTSPRVLFLQHYAQYSVPTGHTLTGQLLRRAGLRDLLAPSQKAWSIPLEHEQIAYLNPDCLIIASSHGESLQKQMEKDPLFQQLPAVQKNRVFFVDPFVQESSCQYIVLAYYDIFQALASVRF